ncbi:MAG: PhoH family protein [Phycisphaerales bacterium JB043]
MEFTITVPRGADRVSMLGSADRNLKMIREALGVNIAARNDTVEVSGREQAVLVARRVFNELSEAASKNTHLSRKQVLDLISSAASEAHLDEKPSDPSLPPPSASPIDWEHLDVYVGGRRLEPRSENQRHYLDTIASHDLVICSGPAGSGKTYLAVASAVNMLKHGSARKIILVRPAVEAGEKLGFLPGDIEQKVNPYLRPLFDALNDMIDYQTLSRFMANDIVEIVPLAFMRGRTLNDAFIILDEAQNTTRAQMQMFLTRMGQRSRMIITGDTTQIDLPDPRQSGLVDAARRLARIKGVGMVTLTRDDIVRHPLVQQIVDAYTSTRNTRKHASVKADGASERTENSDV